MEKIHYKITVRGKVQGVWFRKYTKAAADNLGVFGFVQNESEGSVYIEAEGSKEVRSISRFIIQRLFVVKSIGSYF